MDWVPIKNYRDNFYQNLETSCKLYNTKLLVQSICNYPQAYSKKNFNAIMDEPEEIPYWLTTGILPKLGYSKKSETIDRLHA
jgi:hypothetical protein